ncbi:MAG: DUF763 domain-containing protein [Thermodesulfobacteriota bacterium]|nr:DUF763 domain-containing protein [Thermodesulfobacteriota bacterium]
MRTGVANLPLHGGRAPRWLFQRMVKLARVIALSIVEEFGPVAFLQRISDPFWFQALGCILGFDWHSSGLTTTTCGALKEGLKGLEMDSGLIIAGGKGAASRRTPLELETAGRYIKVEPNGLIRQSRLVAKVDSAAVQDGYQLYHHVFICTLDGDWTVIQQGMNETNRQARRYHWLSSEVNSFVCEPHKAVCSHEQGLCLNLVAKEGEANRKATAQVTELGPDNLVKEITRLKSLNLPSEHRVFAHDIAPERLYRIFATTYEQTPQDFEELLGIKGVGPKSLRALSLVADLLYGAPISFRDPARFSFAHGGKDGHPYPVDRGTYDKTIDVLHKAIEASRIGQREQMIALRRLHAFFD